MGPPFRANFAWAQRFLQISLLLPEGRRPCRARAIPVDLVHAPCAQKPKRSAIDAEWEAYRQKQKQMRASQVAALRVKKLRGSLDEAEPTRSKDLVVAVDGGYANQTFMRKRPAKTTVIARIRRDARLFECPESEPVRKGRRRFYGPRLPTPDQIRQDDHIPWTSLRAYAAGQVHDFEIKTLAPVRCVTTGGEDVRLVIIRPLAYRPRKGARLLYRDPAYLLCTDPMLPLEALLQSYLWRWEIEVNFKEEKTLLGMGEAQVRTDCAAERMPQFMVAAYALLHTAAAHAEVTTIGLPPPKWRRPNPSARISTAGLVNQVRAELWGRALGLNKNGFAADKNARRSPLKYQTHPATAVCYATR
jgi:hypothetical protein